MLAVEMGWLIRRATGDRHRLSARYVVGRSPAGHLTLENRLVSLAHAELLWKGSSWELHDLGSRNGTFVRGRRLETGAREVVRRGAQIAFGDREDLFELVDDGPPSATAQSDDGQLQESEDGYLVLPDADHPVCTLFEEGGRWVVEFNDGTRQGIASGDTLRVAERTWHIELPIVAEHTWQSSSGQMMIKQATMRFSVDRAEGLVEIHLIQGEQVMPLPSRSYHQLLLTLAKARLTDEAHAGVPEAEAGWMLVDKLLRVLDISEPTANVAICRARKDFTQAGVLRAMDLIERQPTPRRMRLGVGKVEIVQV
jgi:pSer/pThr/pTyr-binding forkhead associated (FHA) protein